MNEYFGLGAGHRASFSREDRQLIALNYENLCDSDYLDRLFLTDSGSHTLDEAAPESAATPLASSLGTSSAATAEVLNHINILGLSEKDQPINLRSSVDNKSATSRENDANRDLVDNWLLTGDLPEDLVIFGDAYDMGRSFLERRFVRETSYSLKDQDMLTSLIFRQSLVFHHTGLRIVDLCRQKTLTLRSRRLSPESNGAKTTPADNGGAHFALEALLCAARVLELQSRQTIQSYAVEPMIRLIITVMREDFIARNIAEGKKKISKHDLSDVDKDDVKESDAEPEVVPPISEEYVHYIRSMLCNSMLQLERDITGAVSEKERQAQLLCALSCTYGLLSIGLYSASAGDVLVAVSNIATLIALCDEWKEEKVRADAILMNEDVLADVSTHVGMTHSSSLSAAHARPDSGKKEIIEKQLSKQKRSDSPVTGALSAKKDKALREQSAYSGREAFVSLSLDERSSGLTGPERSADRKVFPVFPGPTSANGKIALPASREKDRKHDRELEKPVAQKLLLDSSAKQMKVQMVKGTGADDRETLSDEFDDQLTVMNIQMQQHQPSKNTSALIPNTSKSVSQEKMKGIKPIVDFPGKSSSSNNNNNNNNSHKNSNKNALKSGLSGVKGNSKAQGLSLLAIPQDFSDSYTEIAPSDKKVSMPPLLRSLRSVQRVPHCVLAVLKECSDSLNVKAMQNIAMQKDPAKRMTEKAKELADGNTSVAVSPHIEKPPQEYSSYVWTSGQNSYGELGHGDVSQRRTFTKMVGLNNKGIVSIGAGNEHSVFVDYHGKLYVCGYNENGQCGVGTTQQIRQVTAVTGLDEEEITQVHVYNGCEHTLAITKDGKLFSFGYNYRGQLGLGSTSSEPNPRLVTSLLTRKVILAASSYHHSFMLCADGSLFSVGRNDCGQLGHGDNTDKKSPQLVTHIPTEGIITSINCGQFHSVLSTSAGTAYSCGKNDYGQLGLDISDAVRILTKLPVFSEGNLVQQVCCGYYHTLVLLQNGVVTGFGRNDYGQLGLGHTQPKVSGYHVITALRDKGVLSISAGCYHSIAVTANGMVYVFGRNNHGQLGTGDLLERSVPHPIDNFVGQKIVQAAAGFYHTIILVTPLDEKPGVIAPDKKESIVCAGSAINPVLHDLDREAATLFATMEAPVLNMAALLKRASLSLRDGSANKYVNQHHVSSPQHQQPLLSADASHRLQTHTTFSMEHRSKIALKETLPFLVTCLHALVITSPSSNNGVCISSCLPMEKVGAASAEGRKLTRTISWLARQLQAISTLFAVCRQSLLSPHLYVEVPLAGDDASKLVRVLLQMVHMLLEEHEEDLIAAYIAGVTSDDQYSAKTKDPSQRSKIECARGGHARFLEVCTSRLAILSAKEMIAQVHSASSAFFQSENDDKNESATMQKTVGHLVREVLDTLCAEILHVYFFLPDSDDSDDHDTRKTKERANESNQDLVVSAKLLISRFFRCFFPTPRIRSDFFTLLANNLTDSTLGAENVVPLDVAKCLRLFSRVCSVCRSHLEVVRIFQESAYDAMIVFQQVLRVYMHWSQLCLEAKLTPHKLTSMAGVELVEYLRSARSIDQSLSSLLKCAAPRIFSFGSGDEDEHISTFGISVVNQILRSSEYALDFLLSQQLPDDLLTVFRHGTVLSSILPSVLLYAISFAEADGCVLELIPAVRTLIRKLQSLSHVQTSSVPNFVASSSLLSSRSLAPESGRAASPSNDSPVSVRRDNAPQAWWVVSLKLCVTLCAKVNSLRVRSAGMNHHAAQHALDAESMKDLVSHKLWRYLSLPSQDMQMYANSSSRKSTAVRSSVRSACAELRQREMITDHAYRLVCQSSKASKTLPLVEAIERLILDVVVHVDGASLVEFQSLSLSGPLTPRGERAGRGLPRNKRLGRMWTQVIRFTKVAHSKRSQLCENSNGMTWLEVLAHLHDVVAMCREILVAGVPKVTYVIRPLLRSSSPADADTLVRSARTAPARAAFRRCVLLILCTLRWKACCKARMRDVGQYVVDFVIGVAERATSGFFNSAVEHMESRCAVLLSHLGSGSSRMRQFASGMEDITSLLLECSQAPMKTGILMMLTVALRESSGVLFDASTESNFDGGVCPVLCSVASAQHARTSALRALEKIAVSVLLDFCAEYSGGAAHASASDLTYLATAVRLLHLFSLSRGRGARIIPEDLSPEKIACLVLLIIENNGGDSHHPSVDEKIGAGVSAGAPSASAGFARKSATKERSKAVRRATNALLSFIQGLAAQLTVNSGKNATAHCNQVMQAQSTLILHFQSTRIQEGRAVDLDPVGNPGSNGSLKAAGGLGGDLLSKSKDLLNGNKRRCQELISRPLEFCRTQEGFVVQGDKLLNNYKGMDFTLAMWLMPSQKVSTTARTVFITGKISHNDAWPLVSLRNDGKIIVIYGHGNEFERVTSQASIPSHSWSHIAVVVEPKKIKLFIDGTMDTQVSTKGNGRAVLYPVVVGSCPQGMRTRVEHVREGFDGLLAQYKYYTRALSPIHVRVVFDQGPPESYDVKERWIFHLIASARLLMHNCGHALEAQSLQSFAKAAHALLISDSAGRLRGAALLALQDVLSLDALTDLTISSNRCDDTSVSVTASNVLQPIFASLMGCSFFPANCVSFYERVVLYFVRIMGACWSPLFHAVSEDPKFPKEGISFPDSSPSLRRQDFGSILPSVRLELSLGDAIANVLDERTVLDSERLPSTQDFVDFTPAFIVADKLNWTLSPYSLPVSTNDMVDKLTPREETCNELCVLICNMMSRLAATNSKWSEAIGMVVEKASQAYLEELAVPDPLLALASPRQSAVSLDALGIAVLCGSAAIGTYLGADVRSYFSDSRCRLLSINRTTGYAVVLSTSTSGVRPQLSVLMATDLSGSKGVHRMPVPNTASVLRATLSVMNTLRSHMLQSVSDLLALHRMEHPYTRQTLLKSLQPAKAYLFMQFLFFVSDFPDSLTNAHFAEFPELFKSLQDAALRVHRRQITPVGDAEADRIIPNLWVKSAKYIATLSDTMASSFADSSQPRRCALPLEMERSFADYVTNQMGIAAEVLAQPLHESLLRDGRLLDLVQAISVGADSSHTKISQSTTDNGVSQRHTPLETAYLPSELYSIPTPSYLAGTPPLPAETASASQASPPIGERPLSPLLAAVNEDLHMYVRSSNTLEWGGGGGSLPGGGLLGGLGLGAHVLSSSSSSEPADIESTNVLRLMLHVRRSIISRARSLLSHVVPSVADCELGFAGWRVTLWEALMAASMHNTQQKSAALNLAVDALDITQRLEFTQTLASALKYTAIGLLQGNANKLGTRGSLLENTDIFVRILHALNVWLDLHESHEFESDVCVNLLKLLLPALSFVETCEAELSFLEICQAALRKLIYHILGGATVSVDLADLSRSDDFILLRARAQEHVDKMHGQSCADGALARRLAQLVTGLELVQRRSVVTAVSGAGIPIGSPSPLKMPVLKEGRTSSASAPALPEQPQILQLSIEITPSPVISGVRSTSVDISLLPCLESKSLRMLLGGGKGKVDMGNVSAPSDANSGSSGNLTEVQLSVESSTGQWQWATVYLGDSPRLVQSCLVPGCSYAMRCRLVRRAIAETNVHLSDMLPWSAVVKFRTLDGTPFVFDSQRRGADILLSEDGITASYAGDDCWSTVLGSRSFTAGVTSWEIRVVQSSTAYVFVGVATSQADLNTFLGGCSNGWGFIGEQSLYHNREKVKVYGEAFSAGDVVGVHLDLEKGQLSFTRNGKSQGVAFEGIYGEIFPAAAFYNMGQELEILPGSFHTTCPLDAVPCSPNAINLHDTSMATEMLYCIHARSPFPSYLLEALALHCNSWCSGLHSVQKMISGRYVVLSCRSDVLLRYGLVTGERVRTPFGVAVVAGSAFDRVWFSFAKDHKHVWYFSHEQLHAGRADGMFLRCTYEKAVKYGPVDVVIPATASDSSVVSSMAPGTPSAAPSLSATPVRASAGGAAPVAPSSAGSATTGLGSNTSSPQRFVINEHHKHGQGQGQGDHTAYDGPSIAELVNNSYWSASMDSALVTFLTKAAETAACCIWDVTTDVVSANYRSLQTQLSKLCLEDATLSRRWGFKGPNRRAVIARLAVLRYLNMLLAQNLNVLVSGVDNADAVEVHASSAAANKFPADSDPTLVSIYGHCTEGAAVQAHIPLQASPHGPYDASTMSAACDSTRLHWPYFSSSWLPLTTDKGSSLGLLQEVRERIFSYLKTDFFGDALERSATRPTKTEDDYDYPEDLPQIKINRIRSFRAREAADLLGVSGEDLMQSTMFYQLWKELRMQTPEQLRVQYTHPMDDGQARAFKIRFDGEGVDDYGGPYREIFQQICDELQTPDPSAARARRLQREKNVRATGASALGEGADPARHPASWEAALSRAHGDGRTQDQQSAMQEDAQERGAASKPDPCFLPLLLPTPNWTAGECSERYCYIFNPASLSALRLDLYRFMGKLVGLAVRSRLSMNLSFPSLLWKTIVRQKLNESDLASVDVHAADFVKHLSAVYQRVQAAQSQGGESNLALAREEAFALVQDLTWTFTRSDGLVLDLIPGGSSKIVQINDIPKYLTAYVQARLTESSAATEAFREGLLSVVPEVAFVLMTGDELRRMVSGADSIDVERLRENTEYDEDVSATDAHIDHLWTVLRGFSELEKAAFLRFVWARSSLPPPGVPFPQKFKIQGGVGDEAGSNPDHYLPRAHTCFFSVNLPRYSSKEVMEEKVRYAIFNCTEMDADFRLTDTDVVGWGSALPASSRADAFINRGTE